MESLQVDDKRSGLDDLLDEIHDLVQHVVERGAYRLARQVTKKHETLLTKSIVNLAHYLALREIDLRPLQERLAEAGLSSLGRAESHVYANLVNVLDLLGQPRGVSQSDLT